LVRLIVFGSVWCGIGAVRLGSLGEVGYVRIWLGAAVMVRSGLLVLVSVR